MKTRRIFIMCVLGLGLALALVVGMAAASRTHAAAQKQGSEPGEASSPQGGFRQVQATALGTAFSYQGHLSDGSGPVDGSCDVSFKLYDDAGSGSPPTGGIKLGSTLQRTVAVTNGHFMVTDLDFGDAFGGEARWLEIAVRCPSGSGNYTMLSPRQALTPTPYALYARNVPLHDHLGQTWMPGDSPSAMTITGTFGLPDYAPLVLSNAFTGTGGAGLRVGSAGGAGIAIGSGALEGLWVQSAGRDGVRVESAGQSGFAVGSAGQNGFAVESAAETGLFVDSAGVNGVQVNRADGLGMHIESAGSSGVVVGSAGGHGTHIISATESGLAVDSAGWSGVWVGNAGGPGFEVASAGQEGLVVRSAGGSGVWVSGTVYSGVEVASAGTDGLSVNRAGASGVWVNQAADAGLAVGSVGGSGVEVHSAGGDGVQVLSAGGSGVWVSETVHSGLEVGSVGGNGVSIGEAGHNGVLVAHATYNGVHVASAGGAGVAVSYAETDGLWVESADESGVEVISAGVDGLRIISSTRDYIRAGSDSDPDFRVANDGTAYADGGWQGAADFAELMTTEGHTAAYEAGDVLMISTAADRAVAISSESYSTLVIGVFSTEPGFIGSPHVMEGQRDDEIPVAVVGIVPCKVSAENGSIRRGDLLVTSSTPGHAMRADGPPPGTILGKALEPLDTGTGLILVLVTLQ